MSSTQIREERFKERVRIAKGHLVKPHAGTVEENFKRFDEILERAKTFPYVKSHAIQAIDRHNERLEAEARFVALAHPIGEWLPKRVIVLGERDAIVEFVSNVDSDIQKVGEVHMLTVVNDECSRIIYDQLDHAMLHYLSVKHEGRSTAFQGMFVRYGMAMLKQGNEGEE